MRGLAIAIGTVCGVGYLRPAPGTWGSLAALPLAWGLAAAGGPLALMIAIPLLYLAGHWATTVMTEASDDHDPSEIVVDEVAGQWTALIPVVYGSSLMQVPLSALWPGWIAAFVLFRLFDVSKWSLVGRFDRRGDPTGVMADDIVAGLFAALGVIVLAALGHGAMRLM